MRSWSCKPHAAADSKDLKHDSKNERCPNSRNRGFTLPKLRMGIRPYLPPCLGEVPDKPRKPLTPLPGLQIHQCWWEKHWPHAWFFLFKNYSNATQWDSRLWLHFSAELKKFVEAPSWQHHDSRAKPAQDLEMLQTVEILFCSELPEKNHWLKWGLQKDVTSDNPRAGWVERFSEEKLVYCQNCFIRKIV